MSLDRVVLALSGAFVLLAGVACVVGPASFSQQAGLSATPSALTEIRAFYGGLQVGVGCFLIWCVRQRALTFAGLLLVAFAVGGAGVARALGMLIDQAPTAFHLTNLAVEATTVALVAVALSRHRRLAHA
jgi:hypothetical protein